MIIRDRIKELRRVRAGLLKPHPKNWRSHPDSQRDALRGMLAEIGYADALIARELDDGSLELIDGHLRAETTPDVEVPVLILDLDELEANKLLALLDPLAGLAETNYEILTELLETVDTENEAVQAILDRIVDEPDPSSDGSNPAFERPEVPIPENFQVVIECHDEAHQQEIYERMTGEGFTCRLLML